MNNAIATDISQGENTTHQETLRIFVSFSIASMNIKYGMPFSAKKSSTFSFILFILVNRLWLRRLDFGSTSGRFRQRQIDFLRNRLNH
jgi:hypothetical protein